MRAVLAIAILLSTLVLPGCQMNERMTGTAGGAAGGVILGAVVADTVAGALIGGAAGALVGYLVGDYIADKRERCACQPAPCAPPSGSATDGGFVAWRPAPAHAPDPTLAQAWNEMGVEAIQAGDRSKAVDCFRQALAADPACTPARRNLALASR